ncbi:MAG TPA: septum formation inhibitor Maf [Marinobacter sp.]|jgi:MAF protein|uniref:Maf family protein n=1 Tax=Marinobacter sp. TaxID=50741 RepID=UPI000EEACEFC|nr:Maf family nucleotide pyrophosphatase [Marinobacter sp.]HCW90400.1 septum formation inhibitor Maf [Marinobacter sp.]
MRIRPLVLASSSPYRRQLLERLGLPFECASPDIDESPSQGESPEQLAIRLSETKARALATRYPAHWIIGSDQVAVLPGGAIAGKPGDHRRAAEQLRQSSGNTVTFLTGLCLLDSATGEAAVRCVPYRVDFRELTESEIDSYLTAEQPWDCAGSFKMEGLGIALFREMQGSDPNSLTGLPLIALTDLLRKRGLNPLTSVQRSSNLASDR